MNIDFTNILVSWTILLFSLCLHEFGHAWVALLCGDDTAKHHGRVTMNPVAHADPLGTVVIPLVMMVYGGGFFGWAKPVPVNPSRLHNYPRDDIFVSLAGIFMNLVLAVCGIVVIRICFVLESAGSASTQAVIQVAWMFVQTNLILAVFNLMPAPPLDGWNVIKHMLPVQWRIRNEAKVFRYGPIFLIVLVISRAYLILLLPAVKAAQWLILV